MRWGIAVAGLCKNLPKVVLKAFGIRSIAVGTRVGRNVRIDTIKRYE